MRMGLLGCVLLAAAISRAAQVSEVTFYNGMCDASGAVSLDEELFVVADDEDNRLRVYHSKRPGPPVKVFDPSGFLRVDPKEPEIDLEGAARIGNRIYWITSHGRNRSAKYRESRLRFFATEILRAGDSFELKPVGQYYSNLLLDLFNDPRLARFKLIQAAALAPKAPGGFNIEGLSATPAGTLLIGFRNPVPQGRALIVPLLNPADAIAGKPLQLGDPMLVDLGGRGIRAIALYEDKFIILAGASDGSGNAKLYFWKGGDAKPEPINADVTAFNPEAVAIYPGDQRLHIMSDDGERKVNGVSCKQLPRDQQSFRAAWITP